MKEFWQTDRTGLAATLVTEGYQLLELVWRPAPKLPGGYVCFFIFAWQPDLDHVELLFKRGALRVEPNLYNRVYGELRQRMRDSRQEQVIQDVAS